MGGLRWMEVGAVCAVACAMPQTARAYLDPGSASLLFQAAAAALFTVWFMVRSQWQAVRVWWRGRRAARGLPDDPPAS